MTRHSHLPPTQRVDLVLAVLRGTEKLEMPARRHQVSANTLRYWRDEFVAADFRLEPLARHEPPTGWRSPCRVSLAHRSDRRRVRT